MEASAALLPGLALQNRLCPIAEEHALVAAAINIASRRSANRNYALRSGRTGRAPLGPNPAT